MNVKKDAPPFGLRDKIGYLLGDLGKGEIVVVIKFEYRALTFAEDLSVEVEKVSDIQILFKQKDHLRRHTENGIASRKKATCTCKANHFTDYIMTALVCQGIFEKNL